MLVTAPPGTQVLDFSFSVPDFGRAWAMGYRAVIGYLPYSPDAVERGCLNHTIVDALLHLGYGWAGVWEVNETRALGGHELGYKDGKNAAYSAHGLGAAPGAVVYATADSDLDPVSTGGYFLGFAQAVTEGGFVGGCYGSKRVVDYIVGQQICKVGWQAEAWSYGRVSQFASIIQRANYKPVAGTDHNDTLLPTLFTLSPDVDFSTAAWVQPAQGEDELTDDEKRQLAAAAEAAAKALGPYPVSVFGSPDNRWLTNTADAPPPAGGVPLAGLNHLPGTVGWILETVTTVREMFNKLNALVADVEALKASGFQHQAAVPAVDPAAIADAVLARVKAKL